MAVDVEFAMNIVQLTGVLIPLLLGLTRYYVSNHEGFLEEVSDRDVMGFTLLLFIPLLLAYIHALAIIFEYGNRNLIGAVIAYGSFLATLYAVVPYTLEQQLEAYALWALGFILSVVSYAFFILI